MDQGGPWGQAYKAIQVSQAHYYREDPSGQTVVNEDMDDYIYDSHKPRVQSMTRF